MNIGLVTSYVAPHLGGIEQIAANLFQGYRRRGYPVRWVSSRIPRTAPREENGLVRVPCFNLMEDLLGVPVPLWGLQGWRALRRLVEWADVLHVLECLYVSSAMAVTLARRRGRPVLLSQNVGFIAYRSRLLNAVERTAYATLGRAVLRGATTVVLATPSAQQYVRRLLGVRAQDMPTVPVGIDTSGFRPPTPDERLAARRRLGLPADGTVVLFAGRLVEKKGVPIVLEVARRLPAARFLVAGDGPLRRMLDQAPANVAWHRSVPPERMVDCYHAADLLLLPSSGEGLPLVVQEAMAAGLPVMISADEPYAAELGAEALGVPREPGAIVERIRALLAGTVPTPAPGARRYAEKHWSVDTMVDRYVALLRALRAGIPT